ncbi:MAG: VOC family protein [Pseudomonadota bacterium]
MTDSAATLTSPNPNPKSGTGRPLGVDGLHHITALSSDVQRNYDFYAKTLGLRFLKKTVNFDDPSVYHFYFGDEFGSAGTVMTFFPRPGLAQGHVGLGQVSLTQFAVPKGSLGFWRARLEAAGRSVLTEEEVFGERRLVVLDPDGLPFAMVETLDERTPWVTGDIPATHAIRGFQGATLAVGEEASLAPVLTAVFGYRREAEVPYPGGTLVRYRSATGAASVLDLHVAPGLAEGVEAAGTVHHVAFSVPNRAAQQQIREAVAALGLRVTAQIDRDYFYAIYFRTKAGILFEVATEEPGFATDEPLEHLGESLRLPQQHEPRRAAIEASLVPIVR